MLGPAGDEYDEIEASLKHGGWYVWTRYLTPQERGKLMAHELHKNMREHYYFDMRAASDKERDKPRTEAPWDAIKKRFNLL